MAKCQFCSKEMMDKVSCEPWPYFFINNPAPTSLLACYPIPYGSEERYGEPLTVAHCHDCGCPQGGYHHPGCDMEECANCRRQLISCNCERYDGKEPRIDDELKPGEKRVINFAAEAQS
jgi:hypothetical protein